MAPNVCLELKPWYHREHFDGYNDIENQAERLQNVTTAFLPMWVVCSPGSLETKVFRSPLTRGATNSQIACKTFYRLTKQKTSPILLFWPCRITAVHSKTRSEGGLSITTSSPFQVGCVVQGETIDLYAQTHHLTRVRDNMRSEGFVGFAAGSFEYSGVSKVQFRNFQLWTP